MKQNKNTKIIKFPSNISEPERQVEAILFAADEPLDLETIQTRLNTKVNLLKILESLKNQYINRGINLICIKDKWSFRTSVDLSKLMNLQVSKLKKLSKATVETLSIIVYHQPVTRSEIEEIRGVSFGSGTLDILLELSWVKPSGRKNVPGKPIQYVTTDQFLSHFNIQKLSDLPNVEELTSAGLIDDGNVDTSIFGTGKFFKEQINEKKENIYSNIDDMLKQSLKPEDE
jgi:segregation and condensation protein B